MPRDPQHLIRVMPAKGGNHEQHSQQFPVADARHPAERSGIRKLAAGAAAAPEIYAELAATDEASARIVESYLAAVDRARAWSSLSLAPFLAARN